MMHFLLLALILGSFYIPAQQRKVVSSPAAPAESNPEYTEYNDDEEGAPDNFAVTETTAPALQPYFEQKNVTIYVKPDATTVKLDCPVKNFDAEHHVILWYMDQTLITNGHEAIQSMWTVDSQFALTITPLTNVTGRNFSCHVMPLNVRRQITIVIGEPPSTASPNAAPNMRYQPIYLMTLFMIFRAIIGN
ncbi:uncharacterized protein LOC115633584 [Scaptodrosophila lebanonensis]|uniref:Uncharacterized protein LOC115633584 n=1 Tax=Drosophila lebanonensis TaxID=7225 RepID=A0A6J2UEJ6_DROLE|nr:uncharacterized protein LOC115633584 [Scaptodrosophila lebanonensis]